MSKRTQAPEFVNFFEEIPAAEVTAPTVEAPVQPAAPNSEVATPEAPAPVETPPTPEEQQIPKSRFDEVYAEAKSTKRELDEVKAALAKIEESKAPTAPVEEGPQLDTEAEAAIANFLKKQGLMSRAEFEEIQRAESAKTQLQSDVRELTGWAKEQGYPEFELEKVGSWAKENNVDITSKASLQAAYLAQNQEAIIQAAIKRGVVATETPKATVEKPGAGTGKAPSAPDEGPKTIQNRIGDVLQSMGISG